MRTEPTTIVCPGSYRRRQASNVCPCCGRELRFLAYDKSLRRGTLPCHNAESATVARVMAASRGVA